MHVRFGAMPAILIAAVGCSVNGTGVQMKRLRSQEAHYRSLMKAVSWRITGTLDTFVISYLVTGKAAIAGTIAAVEVTTKIVIYYLHERVWAVVPWGQRNSN